MAGRFIRHMHRSSKTNFKRTILILLLLTAVAEFVRSSAGIFSVVEGLSMYPTFRPNDVVQTRAPNGRTERGDVVIVTDNRGDLVIKRVIGLPGETVTIFRGFVYINGHRLMEPYLPSHTYTFKSNVKDERPADWQLRQDQFFVMGDNRLHSADSRNFGPISRDAIERVVTLPQNAVKPGLSGVMFTKAGSETTY